MALRIDNGLDIGVPASQAEPVEKKTRLGGHAQTATPPVRDRFRFSESELIIRESIQTIRITKYDLIHLYSCIYAQIHIITGLARSEGEAVFRKT